MSELKIFEHPKFGNLRTATSEDGESLVCLIDVCNVLGLQTNKVKLRLKKGGWYSIPVIDSLGRNQDATFIDEPNFYKAVFQSRKEEAEEFQDWVCEEVLPSIRKHGAYMTPDTIEKVLSDPDTIIQLATTLKVERAKRKQIEQVAETRQKKIEEDAPKVLFTNAVSGSSSSCLIGELAGLICQNGYKIGQNTLFEWLRNNGYLITQGERRNLPKQRFVEQGLFEIKRGVRSGSNGEMKTTSTPKVTGKGQVYFVQKFLEKGGQDAA